MLHIFPVQIRSVARVDSLKSASRDQAVNPESYAGSLLFRGAQESIFAAPDCKGASVRKKSATWLPFRQCARHPSPACNRKNRRDAEIVRSVQTLEGRMGSRANFVSRHPVSQLRGRECSDGTQPIQSARPMPLEQR